MVKSKSSYKITFLYCNVLIFIGLLGLYCYISHDDDIVEGVLRTSCCGGIQPGVHYSETDTKPPHFVKRCFKKRNDGSYQWSGFPCTQSDGGDCCPDMGESECVATTKGGYCRTDDGDYYFRGTNKKLYMKRHKDEPLDIDDANDMEDYYKDRKGKGKYISKEMRQFIARRTKNETYVEEHLRHRRKANADAMLESKNKLEEQSKHIEIITSVSLIHLLFLVVFSILIREEIIHNINGFYELMNTQYLNFTGKNI